MNFAKIVNEPKLYVYLFILSVVFFGFFGIRNDLKKFGLLYSARKDMSSKKMVLETKLKQLKEFDYFINRYGSNINKLDSAMPNYPDIEDYILSVNREAGILGMYVDAANLNYGEDSQVEITMSILGNTDRIVTLIESLELLKRITNVKEISVNTPEVRVIMKIYYLSISQLKKNLDIYSPISGKIDLEFLQSF